MPCVEVTATCPVYDSFRVQQVSGLFDVPLAEKATASFCVEVPDLGEPWQIGLIVGPSGSGKSTIARQAFGPQLYEQGDWPAHRAVVDCFGNLGIKQITGLLIAVGFSSPPSWIKPYRVLSGGQRFRCDLARALSGALEAQADVPPLVAFDEFTSVVDRNVAQVGSAAIARAVRGGRINCRFVAVTCHYDVAEWLEPDWVVDMATLTCQRRRLRRPAIELRLFRCRHAAWTVFAPHHYLSGSLSKTARCFLATWQGKAVAFCATLPAIGRRNHWRITRVVTLPDYQGIGIGMKVAEAVAEIHRAQGHRLNVTASHPAMLSHCASSPLWRTARVLKSGAGRTERFVANYHGSRDRAVVSFEYLGSGTKA